MKRIISIVIVIAACVLSFSAQAQSHKDVHISYEQIVTDASLKQFLKASKINQIEILNFLVDAANEAYLKCETIEELYEVKEKLAIIKHYNNSAKQSSMPVTHAIRVLDNKITRTEIEYKGGNIIIENSVSNYSNRGQELD